MSANGGSTPPVYTNQYSFDSFGRLHTVTNPDGEVIPHRYDSGGNLNSIDGRLHTVTMPDNEVITHRYDSGGNLASIDGRLNGHPYTYLERLDYDKFEQRVYLKEATAS